MSALECPVKVAAARHPGALALTFEAARWSYAALDEAITSAAVRLEQLGVRRGHRVAVLSFNTPEVLLALFAVRRIGATLVPLNARLTAEELRPQIMRAEPMLVLADASLGTRIAGARGLSVLSERGNGAPSGTPLGLGETWAILFTSGTSGCSKAAELTVGNIEANIAGAASFLEPLAQAPEARWLGTLPLFHVGGLVMAARCFRSGATLVLARRFEPSHARETLLRERITHASLVPTTLQALLETPGAPRPDLHVLLVGGGPTSYELAARARASGLPVLLTYGLTEASSQVTTERRASADGRTAGTPLEGVQIRILDAAGAAVPPGVIGDLQIRGPTVMRGYFRDAEGTAAAFDAEWLRTGDLGSLDAEGRLSVHARRSDLILSGGENIYPAEVEAALAEHPAVCEVAVVGIPDARWGQTPVACVVLAVPTSSATAAADLERFARTRLAGFKTPRRYLFLDALPRTAAGKVLRPELRDAAEAASNSPPSKGMDTMVAHSLDPAIEASEFLGRVESELERVLSSGTAEAVAKSDTLINAGKHLCIGGGGKRVRPMMVRLFGQAIGAEESQLLSVAVAAELVHSASLLHDDVVDQGMFRRGRPTVNALWGNIVSVMGGDLLLTISLQQLANVVRRVTFDAVETVAEMTRATIAEVEARGDLSLPFERYRDIAEGKTGALFGFCGSAAAVIAGKLEARELFNSFGRHLGVAFQIADDLKDLNEGDPGKPPFADFRSRTPSLPILLAAQQDDALRKRIKDLWAFGSMPDEKVRDLGGAVLASSAPAQALDLMKTEISAALDALGPYADTSGGAELLRWAHKLAEAFRA